MSAVKVLTTLRLAPQFKMLPGVKVIIKRRDNKAAKKLIFCTVTFSGRRWWWWVELETNVREI